MALAESNFLGSSLNPNAPDFVPQSYKQVEDFSPEWWYLVQTSSTFQDFWTREHAGQIDFTGTPLPVQFEDGTFLPEEEDVVYNSVLEGYEVQEPELQYGQQYGQAQAFH